MSSERFPRARILIHDYAGNVALPQDGKAFVHFNFILVEEFQNCPIINRIVIGQDRDAVGKYHQNNLNNIPAPRKAWSTSRLGTGQIVVLSEDGTPTSFLDQLIMMSDVAPQEPPGQLQVATRIVTADDHSSMDTRDRIIFRQLQADCTHDLNRLHQQMLDLLVQSK